MALHQLCGPRHCCSCSLDWTSLGAGTEFLGGSGHGVMDLPPQHRPAGAQSHHTKGLGRSSGLCGALEGVVRGASSFLLPQLHQEQPLRDVSPMGCWSVAALESSGCPGLVDFSDGALRRRKGRELRGKEEERRRWGFEGFTSV